MMKRKKWKIIVDIQEGGISYKKTSKIYRQIYNDTKFTPIVNDLITCFDDAPTPEDNEPDNLRVISRYFIEDPKNKNLLIVIDVERE